MKRLVQISFLLLLFNSVFGQTEQESFWKTFIDSDVQSLSLESFDSISYDKVYRIWNSYQVLELIKIDDSNFKGQLVNFVMKMENEDVKDKMIFEKFVVANTIVENLFRNLENENIETLPDSDNVIGYENGEDGTTYIFEIKSKSTKRIYSYWEPENDYYQNPEITEVKKVRNILNFVKAEINLKMLFDNFVDNLKPGIYSDGGIIMTIKNK